MIRRLAAVTAAGMIGGALVLAGTAHADEHQLLPAEPWMPINTGTAPGEDGWTPDAPQVPSDLSHIVDPWTAVLEWEDGNPESNLGTSIETPNLGLEVADGTVLTFRYTLEDGATCGGGAPRVFVEVDGTIRNTFDHGDACGSDGVASMTIADGGKIGYAGLVYDNLTPGKVTITDFTIGDRLILFAPLPTKVTPVEPTITASGECEVADTLNIPAVEGVVYTVDPEYTEGATGTFAVTATAEEGFELKGETSWKLTIDEPDKCPAPKPDEDEPKDEAEKKDEEKLAATGAPLQLMIGAGLLLLVGGGAAMAMARRRGIV